VWTWLLNPVPFEHFFLEVVDKKALIIQDRPTYFVHEEDGCQLLSIEMIRDIIKQGDFKFGNDLRVFCG